MSRSRLIMLALLALVVALVPLIPHGSDAPGRRPQGTLDAAPRLTTAATAGPSRVTAAMRATIRRTVTAAPALPSATVARAVRATGMSALGPRHPLATDVAQTLTRSLVRCATFDGQRYCLGEGWTDRPADSVRAGVATALRHLPAADAARAFGAAAPPASGAVNTGDLSPAAALLRLARLSPAARERQETAELTTAARSVAKVWLLRHELQGVPLPAGFLQRHPEAAVPVAAAAAADAPASPAAGGLRLTAAGTQARAAATKKAGYPATYKILHIKRVAAQQRTYWCGVAATQMIVWNWSGHRRTQLHWARELGTTTDGTSITNVVKLVNRHTGWDNKRHAGPYIVLDISDWSYSQWFRLIEKHISKYHAPVVLHPILLKKYFPYLAYDASGHFQVGRAYKRRPGSNLISYFEPWNQQRFNPSVPYIARVQWRSAYRSYRANEAHFQHDIGV